MRPKGGNAQSRPRDSPIQKSSRPNQSEFADRTVGGPTSILARGGGAVAQDFGQELIDLIQNTISPASWDVNGGQATLFYYQPVFALVVRAPAEVHANLGDMLDGLRAAGK